MRSGTVPTPLVVGLGAACDLANREMEYDHQHVKRLSDMLVQVIEALVMIVILFKFLTVESVTTNSYQMLSKVT